MPALLLLLAVVTVGSAAPTLDATAQDLAERAIARTLQRTQPTPEGGTIVVLDLRSSAFVAVASGPEAGRHRAGEALPPGSVLKPFVALSFLEAGVTAPVTRVPCPARLSLAGATLRNHVADDLPAMRIDEALAHSCNTVFYRLASVAWRTRRFNLERTLRDFGFGRATGVLPREDAGFVPHVTTEREALSLSIGQAAMLVTPAQLALAYASIVTGAPVTPRALDGTVANAVGLASAQPAIVRGLRGAATYGTAAKVFADVPLGVAAKTGTAQFGARPTSWFVAVAPADAPRYVVVAAFENAGFGADVAAPAAREVLEGLFGLPSSGERFLDPRLALILAVALGGTALQFLRARRRRGLGVITPRARP